MMRPTTPVTLPPSTIPVELLDHLRMIVTRRMHQQERLLLDGSLSWVSISPPNILLMMENDSISSITSTKQ